MTFLDVFLIGIGILFAIAVLLVISSIINNQSKTKVLLAAEKLGTNFLISRSGGMLSDPVLQFEYKGTVFNGKVFILKYHTHYRVDFDLPFIQEKFLIRTNSTLANLNEWMDGGQEPSVDSRPVSTSALPGNYLVYSVNEDFLLSVIEDEKVFWDINNYDSQSPQYVKIWFDTGHFEIFYCARHDNRGENLRQVCETAMLFHDRMKLLTDKTTKNGINSLAANEPK